MNMEMLTVPALKIEQFHLGSERHKNRKYSQVYSDTVLEEIYM